MGFLSGDGVEFVRIAESRKDVGLIFSVELIPGLLEGVPGVNVGWENSGVGFYEAACGFAFGW